MCLFCLVCVCFLLSHACSHACALSYACSRVRMLASCDLVLADSLGQRNTRRSSPISSTYPILIVGLVLADPHPTDTLTGVDWSCFARRIVGGSAGLRGVHSSALGPGSSQFIDSPSEMPVRHLAKRICGWNLLEYGGTVFPRQVVPQVESQFLLNRVIPVSSLTIQVFKFPTPNP